MGEATIERLNLDIASNAAQAAVAVDKLATSITALRSAVNTGVPALAKFKSEIVQLRGALPDANKHISSLATRLGTLNKQSGTLKSTTANVAKFKTTMAGVTGGGGGSPAQGFGVGVMGALGGVGTLIGRLAVAFYTAQRIFAVLRNGFNSTVKLYSDLIEAQNLFEVSMKASLPTATAFVNKLAEGTGMDPKDLMTFQGVFYSIAKSMQVPLDKAYQMSEGLTQLSYDFASFRNMEPDYVFVKLRGAIVGEARAMRELGIDITQAAMQEEAQRLGIKAKIKEMTQAQKAQLRYNVIMRNSTDAQGDMARTLNQPANMMRLFSAQMHQAGRAIGAMFIPFLQMALPWLIAFAKATRDAFAGMAQFFGIKMPEFVMPGSNGLGDVFGETADEAGNAAEEVKKLKDYMLGIDELNVLSPENDKGDGGPPVLDIPIPDTYDFFKDFMAPFDKLIAGIKEKMKALAQPFVDFFAPLTQALGVIGEALAPVMSLFRASFVKMKADMAPAMEVMRKGWKAIQPILTAIGNIIGTVVIYALALVIGVINGVINALAPLAKAFGGVLEVVGGTFDLLVGIVEGDGDAINAAFTQIKVGIVDTFSGLWGAVVGFVKGFCDGVKKFFTALADELVGHSIVPDMVNDIIMWFYKLPGSVKAVWDAIYNTTVTTLIAVRDSMGWVWGTIQTKTREAWDYVYARIKAPMESAKATVLSVGLGIRDTIILVWENIKYATRAAWDWIASTGIQPLRDMWNNTINPIFDAIRTVASTTWDSLDVGLSAAWDSIKAIFRGGVNYIINMLNGGPLASINSMISAYNGLNGSLPDLPLIPTMPNLAAGGSPEMGSMFVAGEVGPELVGSYRGNPNTVMPLENSGFVEAVGRAVFSAVAEAMSLQSDGDGGVYLDGKLVGEILRDRDRKSGVDSSLVKVSFG